MDPLTPLTDEFLRYESPVQLMRRLSGHEMELCGQKPKKGDMLVILIGSANRDPAEFENADRVDITRTKNKHLAFGMGIHHCLGSSLAEAEGQIAVSTLLKRLPELKLKTDRLEYKIPFALRGLKSLPVAF